MIINQKYFKMMPTRNISISSTNKRPSVSLFNPLFLRHFSSDQDDFFIYKENTIYDKHDAVVSVESTNDGPRKDPYMDKPEDDTFI